jgi:hypothetical protein
MNDRSNLGIPPDEPNVGKRQARDALDDIDEAVARITDRDIGERLSETLRRAGYLKASTRTPIPT